MPKDIFDLIVVGAGVLGTFHAYHAMRRGLTAAILERDKSPQGATVRNFGQIVPSGMNLKWQTHGRESLRLYKEIQSKFNISVRQEGTVYLASDEEELQLIEELHVINMTNDYRSEIISRKQCLSYYPGLRNDYIKAGLFFPEEITVEPRTMIGLVHSYLKSKGLELYNNTSVLSCHRVGQNVSVQIADGRNFYATKVIICNGSDFKVLYPELFKKSELQITKLQMMQTKPQPHYRLKGSVLTGLSVRRYEAFSECPSFAGIKAAEVVDSPIKKWGIHILFKQGTDGTIILGDSHEYADVVNSDTLGFSLNMDIDNVILEESKKVFDLPTYEIQNRWFGLYSQCKTLDIYQASPEENIHIVTGIGGKGMTGSAGFAQSNINQLF